MSETPEQEKAREDPKTKEDEDLLTEEPKYFNRPRVTTGPVRMECLVDSPDGKVY